MGRAGGAVREDARTALQSLHAALDADVVTKRIMVQELVEDNELTRAIAAARETWGVKTTDAIRSALSSSRAGERDASATIDYEARIAAASAAVFFLTLKADRARMFNGIDLHTDEGWFRICDALAAMIGEVAE